MPDQCSVPAAADGGARGGSLAWQQDARCPGTPLHLWFPATDDAADVAAAKAVCAGCPVVDPCRSYALDTPWLLGVWGGLDERDRRLARRARMRPAATAPERLLTREDVARLLGVSLVAVDRLIEHGALPRHGAGRRRQFRADEVAELDRRRSEGFGLSRKSA